MANKRRAANRRKSERDYRMEEEGDTSSGWSGSPRHTETRGKHGDRNEYAKSAGELTAGTGPGRMAMRVTPHSSGMPNEAPASGEAPKDMKRYTEE